MLLPSDPVSQYICIKLPKTDDNDRTNKNDAKCKYPILTYGQYFFPDRCFIGRLFHVKWSKPGHDSSQNLIKNFQVVYFKVINKSIMAVQKCKIEIAGRNFLHFSMPTNLKFN